MRVLDALHRAGSSGLQSLQGHCACVTDGTRIAGEIMLRAALRSRLGPTDRKKLIAGIHAQAKTLQLDPETRREMQQQLVGVASTKDMSLGQLSTVWSRLTVLAADAGLSARFAAFSPGRKRPGRDERQPDELVTEEQKIKINELFDELGITAVGQARMNFSRRTCGSTWPQTREQANKIVEALKAMEKRGWRARGAEGAANTGMPPCSLPAHDQNVLGQCAQSEAIPALPASGGIEGK